MVGKARISMSMTENKKLKSSKMDAFWLFLIACFSMTQIRLGAKIGISEIFMVLLAPFLYFKNLRYYRSDGMLTMLNLLLLWILGALFADWYNDAVPFQYWRGFSVPVMIFSTVVCIYNFLRRDIRNFKWIIFGLACSTVISTFVFQRGAAGDLAAEGDISGAIERVMSYKLFWLLMIQTWVLLPIQVFYMKLPFIISLTSVLFASLIAALSGGRSAMLVSLMSFMLIFFARRSVQSMGSIKRYLVFILIILSLVGVGVKYAYKYAFAEGMLNETETAKYERQTSTSDSILGLLMSGRSAFFIGLRAIIDKPIIGHGSWALDDNGYAAEFLNKYGSDLDRLQIARAQREAAMTIIPSHSHIVCYWLWHGISGFLFWAYVIFLAARTFSKNLHIIPEMFGYWAVVLPAFFWDVFFSPFGLRTGECAMFVLMVLTNKIAKIARREA